MSKKYIHLFSTEELRKDKCVEKWLPPKITPPTTKITYIDAIQLFSDFTKMLPSEFVRVARVEFEDRKHMQERLIYSAVLELRDFCLENGLSVNSINVKLAAIASFCEAHYIEIPKRDMRIKNSQPLEKNEERATREDIAALLKVADKKEKAIVLAGVSSGMSADELGKITEEQFLDGYDPETKVCTITARRNKTGVAYITFFNPEATKSIIEYIEWKNRLPTSKEKTVLDAYKKRKSTPKCPLFIKERVSDKYLETNDEKFREMTTKNIIRLYSSLSNRAGLDTESGSYNKTRSHNMRKYFTEILKNNGMEYEDVEFMMAHKQDATKAAYNKFNSEVLKERYMQKMHHLYIETELKEELDVTTTQEYQAVVKEKEELQNQVFDVSKAVEYVREKSEEFKSIQEEMSMMIDILGKEKYQELKMKVEMMKTEEAMGEIGV